MKIYVYIHIDSLYASVYIMYIYIYIDTHLSISYRHKDAWACILNLHFDNFLSGFQGHASICLYDIDKWVSI